jgi:hypothetical protein
MDMRDIEALHSQRDDLKRRCFEKIPGNQLDAADSKWTALELQTEYSQHFGTLENMMVRLIHGDFDGGKEEMVSQANCNEIKMINRRANSSRRRKLNRKNGSF